MSPRGQRPVEDRQSHYSYPQAAPARNISLAGVTAKHAQLAHVFNSEVLDMRNRAYEAHMTHRPATLDRGRFDPTAVLADELMSAAAGAIGSALMGVDVSSMDAASRAKLTSETLYCTEHIRIT